MTNKLVWKVVKTAKVSKDGAYFDLYITKNGKYGLSFVPYQSGEYNAEHFGDFDSEQAAMLAAQDYADKLK